MASARDRIVGAVIALLIISQLSVGPAAAAAPVADAAAPIAPSWTICMIPPAGSTPKSQAESLLLAVNRFRVANGLSPLAPNAILTSVALAHSVDMSAHDFFDHVGSSGLSYVQRAQRAGYESPMVGETLAAGVQTGDGVVALWAGSESHKAFLLRSELREVGAGYVYDPADRPTVRLPGGAISGPFCMYWALEAGARSDVYPIVIDLGASTTRNRTVHIDVPGLSAAAGTAVRFSTSSDYSGASWNPCAAGGVSFDLPAGAGLTTVYGQARLANGTLIDLVPASIEFEDTRLRVSATELTFLASSAESITSPGTATIEVSCASMNVTWNAGASDSWLSVQRSGDLLQARVRNWSSLSPGSYDGEITISSPEASNSPQTIDVHLVVTSHLLQRYHLPVAVR